VTEGRRDSSLRRRHSLRIPDDEVTRPSDVPIDGPTTKPPVENTEVALTPTPIITINVEPPVEAIHVEPPVDAQAAVSRLPGAPPTLPDITVEDPAASSDSQVDAADSTPKVAAPPSGDDIDVRFDDDASGQTSIATTPRVLGDGDRRSEPGDAPEVAAEDVMTVEPPLVQVAPLPPPVSQAAPLPPPV
jgi:hypothetical protein